MEEPEEKESGSQGQEPPRTPAKKKAAPPPNEMLLKPPAPQLHLLGVDVSGFSTVQQFAMTAAGIFTCYLVYGVVQEQVTNVWKAEHIGLGWWLTMVQCVVYSSFSRMGQSMHTQETSTTPWSAFALIGFLSCSTIGLSNVALQHLQYATQVAFKSSKPVPVMLVGVCILGKSYSAVEYIATFILTAGLVMFTTADEEIGEFDPVGVIFISMALIVDGIIGNVQQRTFSRYPEVSPSEMIYRTKAIAAALSFVIFLMSGELFVAIDFYSRHPSSLLALGLYSLVGVLGETFVMAMIKRFGALAAVITTSVRKALTMILSFIIFHRVFTLKYAFASMLVWSGVAMHIWADSVKRARKREQGDVRHV